MAARALAFGFGGHADLDLTFGEFFHSNHTVMLRFMPQHPYAGPGPMLAENGSGTYIVGQGDYRWGSGDFKTLGPSTLFIQLGTIKAIYEVPGVNQVGGPIGYRDVWQHLTVVRQKNTIKLYLNGQHLQPVTGADLVVPTSGLPTNSTPIRIGRRSNGSDKSNLFWQFYGLIDDVAIYKVALSENEIQNAVNAPLKGTEQGLLAGWTFDDAAAAPVLSRSVILPTAADIPQHVNNHAPHPIPVYYVNVSANRDSTQDCQKMDIRPSKVRATVPFGAGEWWRVVQGWEHPNSSHNGDSAAFCFDFARVNGETFRAPVVAVAPGRVIFAKETENNGQDNAISVYHTIFERGLYMHIQKDSFSTYFPNLPGPPQSLAEKDQPTFAFLDPLCKVGDFAAGGDHDEDHLHFATSAISDTTWGPDGANAGYSLPNALENYYVSKNKGATWTHVARGIPSAGEWIARYPWSPWGGRATG